jgi:hypothetical protein
MGDAVRRRETIRGTKADAQRRSRELLHEVETGGHVMVGRLTVAVLCEHWLAGTRHRVAARTFEFYAAIVRLYIVPTVGSIKAEPRSRAPRRHWRGPFTKVRATTVPHDLGGKEKSPP